MKTVSIQSLVDGLKLRGSLGQQALIDVAFNTVDNINTDNATIKRVISAIESEGFADIARYLRMLAGGHTEIKINT
jgi:hypothetical protein